MKRKNKNTEEIKKIVVFFSLICLIGIIFYTYIENFSIIDSIYFVFITITTIGYGDLYPKSDIGKLFTVIYSFIGVITFFYMINKFIEMEKKGKR